jgi:hypothetical protein
VREPHDACFARAFYGPRVEANAKPFGKPKWLSNLRQPPSLLQAHPTTSSAQSTGALAPEA